MKTNNDDIRPDRPKKEPEPARPEPRREPPASKDEHPPEKEPPPEDPTRQDPPSKKEERLFDDVEDTAEDSGDSPPVRGSRQYRIH